MRITKHTQDKLQDILKALGYQIRYEKGTFQGGYCLVMDRKLIMINKFHPQESKINLLIDIVRKVEIEAELLEPEQLKLVETLKQQQT
ncbi:MAG: hypothetical protein SF053_08070 [Bacteroidia bacterium]|nr:hypothetical protein [Bacteroidia bacterium]